MQNRLIKGSLIALLSCVLVGEVVVVRRRPEEWDHPHTHEENKIRPVIEIVDGRRGSPPTTGVTVFYR